MSSTDAERKIDVIVKTIEQIPTLPLVSSHIQSLFHDEDVSLKKLEEIIERDPPLATKLLKLVNSSFYGLLNKISTIDHALVILGFKEVRNVVLGFSLQNHFNHTNELFDPKQFWRHSIICSQIAKYLGKHFNTVDDGTFFLSGLIHDIGKLVIEQYFPDEFSRIIQHISDTNATFSQAEKEIIGVTHYQIAAKLLQQWHFPRRVIMQVFYHHAPWHDKNYSSGSTVIYLANILSKLAGYQCYNDEHKISQATCLSSTVCEYLNKNGFELDADSLSLLQASIAEFIAAEHDKVLRLFG